MTSVRARGCTIVEYVAALSEAGVIEAREAAADQEAIQAMLAASLPPLDT